MPYSLDTYERALQGALEVGYRFWSFRAPEDIPAAGGLALRHDVDADLVAALAMAERESFYGVRATYFVMTQSPLYNLFSRQSLQLVESILSSGHELGLHYDAAVDAQLGRSREETQSRIAQAAEFLEHHFGARVASVSFHQPSRAILSNPLECGSRSNTYGQKLNALKYLSDSNRGMKIPKDARRMFAQYFPESLQVLVHPMWWVYSNPDYVEVWNQAIADNFASEQRTLLGTERMYGPERKLDVLGLDDEVDSAKKTR